MAEIKTADAADGSVKVQSPQTEPKPKSVSDKASETTETPSRPKRKLPQNQPTTEVKRNERGVPISQWDNEAGDPNKRKSIADDPTGESNVFDGH